MTHAPFLYLAGHHITDWRNITYMTTDVSGYPYWIDLGQGGALTLTPDNARALLIALADTLYDHGHLTIETATQLAYVANATLADNEPVVADDKCPNCNGHGDTGPAYDPDVCGACRGTGVKS